jgi:hypothetical protein
VFLNLGVSGRTLEYKKDFIECTKGFTYVKLFQIASGM